MVPAMTARDEKIATAAAEPTIEKVAPAGVRLGAGRATSAAGGRVDLGSDPAGTNATQDADMAGPGGRASSAAETSGSARRGGIRPVTGTASPGPDGRGEAAVSGATRVGATI
jgi:hypothetical protein